MVADEFVDEVVVFSFIGIGGEQSFAEAFFLPPDALEFAVGEEVKIVSVGNHQLLDGGVSGGAFAHEIEQQFAHGFGVGPLRAEHFAHVARCFRFDDYADGVFGFGPVVDDGIHAPQFALQQEIGAGVEVDPQETLQVVAQGTFAQLRVGAEVQQAGQGQF